MMQPIESSSFSRDGDKENCPNNFNNSRYANNNSKELWRNLSTSSNQLLDHTLDILQLNHSQDEMDKSSISLPPLKAKDSFCIPRFNNKDVLKPIDVSADRTTSVSDDVDIDSDTSSFDGCLEDMCESIQELSLSRLDVDSSLMLSSINNTHESLDIFDNIIETLPSGKSEEDRLNQMNDIENVSSPSNKLECLPVEKLTLKTRLRVRTVAISKMHDKRQRELEKIASHAVLPTLSVESEKEELSKSYQDLFASIEELPSFQHFDENGNNCNSSLSPLERRLVYFMS